MPIKPTSFIENSGQTVQNSSFDKDYGVNTVESLGHDGVNLQRLNADALALKVTVSGSITYVGIAAPGTAQATAKWQCKKIDETTGTVVTWADGDADFNNVATDLTSLIYS